MSAKRKVDWDDVESLNKAWKDAGYIVREFARRYGMSSSWASESLNKAWRKGVLERPPNPARTHGEIPPDYRDVLSPEGRAAYSKDAEIKHLKKENKRLQEAVVHQEDFFDRVVAESKEAAPAPNFSFRQEHKGHKRRDAILHLSDWHYGQEVQPESVPGGVNVFNYEVFVERLGRFVDSVSGVLEDLAPSHTFENLVFAMGGDMVEGLGIFEGQAHHIFEDPAKQVVNACTLFGGAMHELMGVAVENCGFSDVSIMAVPGNHGKPGGRRAGATPTTYSWDWLFYKFLEKHLANYPIYAYAVEPAGECYFVSKNHTFSMHHGDEIRGWGGIPHYGITRHDARTIRANHLIHDYGLLGHHHQQAEIPVGFGVTWVNGNAVGPNNLKRFTGSGPAMQRIFITSEEYGVAYPVPIYLQSREERITAPVVHNVGA